MSGINECSLNGITTREHPRLRWAEVVQKDIVVLVKLLEEMAADRVKWCQAGVQRQTVHKVWIRDLKCGVRMTL